LADAWYRYRDEAIEAIAKSWCEEHQIEYNWVFGKDLIKQEKAMLAVRPQLTMPLVPTQQARF
jgi:hypothetical protein